MCCNMQVFSSQVFYHFPYFPNQFSLALMSCSIHGEFQNIETINLLPNLKIYKYLYLFLYIQCYILQIKYKSPNFSIQYKNFKPRQGLWTTTLHPQFLMYWEIVINHVCCLHGIAPVLISLYKLTNFPWMAQICDLTTDVCKSKKT